MDITAGHDFLGPCDQKVHTSKCPILVSYGVIAALNLKLRVKITEKKGNKILNKINT
jgi:hypothetical protein